MNYVALGCACTAIAYIFLCYLLHRGGAIQNFATWLLWAILDVIIGAAVIFQDGNWQFILIYVLGCTSVLITVYKNCVISWTWRENLITVSVFICMAVWAFSGPWLATIVGTSAVVLAGIPQLIDTYKRPEENPILVYIGFFIGNIFSTAGGKDWSVEERFYPASMAFFCAIYILVIARKFIRAQAAIRKPL